MTQKEALRLIWDLAAGNTLTPREAGNDPDLQRSMKAQNEALDITWAMLLNMGDTDA